MPRLFLGLGVQNTRKGVGGEAAPSNIPLSTTNINITYNGTTRPLSKFSDTLWYNDQSSPPECENFRFSLRYQNSQWEFFQRFDYIDEGCNTGDESLESTNAGASSSIPVSGWSVAITITAA
jgi:hypothetical protein